LFLQKSLAIPIKAITNILKHKAKVPMPKVTRIMIAIFSNRLIYFSNHSFLGFLYSLYDEINAIIKNHTTKAAAIVSIIDPKIAHTHSMIIIYLSTNQS